MRRKSYKSRHRRVEALDFFTRWCVQCEMQRRNVERAAADFEGQARLTRVDVEVAQDMVWRYDVSEVPLLLVLADGEEVTRLAGVQPPEAIAAALMQGLTRTAEHTAGLKTHTGHGRSTS